MKINEIMIMFEEDSTINRAKLESEAIETPLLYSKYLNMLHTEIGMLKLLLSKQKTMELKKFQYYSGSANPSEYKESPFEHRVLKTDLPKYIMADPEFRSLDDKIELQTNKVKYLESCVKGISNRNWNIRNAIDMMKFNSGVG